MPTTVVHGVARAQRLSGEEIVLTVHVHGALHGLRCTERIARELGAEIEAVLAQPHLRGQPAIARSMNYAEAAAIGAPITKSGGRVL